jgi:sugar lactone lactonase YvrE
LVAKISDGVNLPEQLAFDQAKTLYVVNSNISTVSEYPAGATHPSVTLTTGLEYPSGIAIDAKGDIFVSNNINYATIVDTNTGRLRRQKKEGSHVGTPESQIWMQNVRNSSREPAPSTVPHAGRSRR